MVQHQLITDEGVTMTTHTAIADVPRFDMNTVPIWAIDAIRHIRRVVEGCTILSFTRDTETVGTPDAAGVLQINIAGEGDYSMLLVKSDMVHYARVERLGGDYTYIPPMFPSN